MAKVKSTCYGCGGYGMVSYCCEYYCWNGKCASCGKFTKERPCGECEGDGYVFEKKKKQLKTGE